MSASPPSAPFQTALEALVAMGNRPTANTYDPEGYEQQTELNSRRLLQELLQGPVVVQQLLRQLAELRHPQLRRFARPLRERLGGAALEPETLAAVRRGLSNPDDLVAINALSLAACSPDQLHEVEAEVVAVMKRVEATTRMYAANALHGIPRLSPASLEELKSLSLRHSKYPDGRAARDALVQHGAPVFLPQGGIQVRERLLGVLPLPVLSQLPAFLGEDGALYFAFERVSTLSAPTPEQGWGPWAGTSGLARLRLTAEGPRVELFQLPVGTVLEFKLAARVGRELLCVLSHGLHAKGGGRIGHYFLFFDPAQDSWSLAPPEDGLPGPRRLPLDTRNTDPQREDPLQDPSLAVLYEGHYLVWASPRGPLLRYEDDTRYDTVNARRSDGVKGAYNIQSLAHDAATQHHRLGMRESQLNAEPWTLGTAKPLREGVWSWNLYGASQVVFGHFPGLRRDEVPALTCLHAHQLRDASGQPRLVLFTQAVFYDPSRSEQCLLVLEPGEAP